MRFILIMLAICFLLTPPLLAGHHHQYDRRVNFPEGHQAEPARPAGDGEPVAMQDADGPAQPEGPLVLLGLNEPQREFINWLSSTDQPKTFVVVPPQRLFVRISALDEQQSPFVAKWVEIFLDGRVVSDPTTTFKSFDPQFAQFEIDCPPTGRHVLQSRYLSVDGRWSRYSQAIYFDVQRPAAPQIVGLCDGQQCPLVPVDDGLSVIRTSFVIARLANVQNTNRVVAYLDGATAPLKQVQNCGLEVCLKDLTPGLHTLAFRVVGDGHCAVGGDLSSVMTFQYAPNQRQRAWLMCGDTHECPPEASSSSPCDPKNSRTAPQSQVPSGSGTNPSRANQPMDGRRETLPAPAADMPTQPPHAAPAAPTPRPDPLKPRLLPSDNPTQAPQSRVADKVPVYFTTHYGAQDEPVVVTPVAAHLTAPIPSSGDDGHAASAPQTAGAKPRPSVNKCLPWKQLLAFDHYPELKVIEDRDAGDRPCYDQDHAFPDPAHFAVREFGNRGEVFPREGLIIYEGMRLRWCSKSGHYEVSFAAEAPPEPVTLRLQFVIGLKSQDGKDWRAGNYTITLPPIRLEDSEVRSQRESKSWTIRHTGYSPILCKGQVCEIRRLGTARFGFNTTRESDE